MLSQTVAIVTGGSSGLGAASARALIRRGARVCVADLASQESIFNEWSQQFLTESKDDLKGTISTDSGRDVGPVITYAATDVTDSNQICKALDHVAATFGEQVNTAINCAGIAIAKKTLSKSGPHPIEDFTRTVMVNMIGTFNMNRLAAERIVTREVDKFGLRGCIVNTASIAGYEGQIGQVAYAASKGGVIGMTLPMARDLAGYGIRVMTIVGFCFSQPCSALVPRFFVLYLKMSFWLFLFD